VFLQYMNDDELRQKSIKELRAMIAELGIDSRGAIEKTDLVQLLVKAPQATPSLTPSSVPSSHPSSGTINLEKSKRSTSRGIVTDSGAVISGLTCSIASNYADDSPPSLVCILCHGYGAGGDDLLALAANLFPQIPQEKRIKFVFPAGPVSLAAQGMGRAWYPLDIEKMIMRAMSGQLAQMMAETPPGLADARKSLSDLVLSVASAWNCSLDRIVLGGFSQGATTAIDTALHLELPLGGVVLWSPVVASLDEWISLAEKKKDLNVVHAHGTKDALVPFFMAQVLEEKVLKPHMRVDFTAFEDAHTIPAQSLVKLLALIKSL